MVLVGSNPRARSPLPAGPVDGVRSALPGDSGPRRRRRSRDRSGVTGPCASGPPPQPGGGSRYTHASQCARPGSDHGHRRVRLRTTALGIVLVTGLEHDQATFILEIHHSVIDGTAGIVLLVHLLDLERGQRGKPSLDPATAGARRGDRSAFGPMPTRPGATVSYRPASSSTPGSPIRALEWCMSGRCSANGSTTRPSG
jgi:hypothetical protein